MKQERFTEQAQEAITLSQKIVQQYQHNQWDIEHILLALLQQERGLVSEIFSDLGIDVNSVKLEIETVLRSLPKVAYQTGQIYATPRVGELFKNAEEEANRLKDEFIGTEHLLIAITKDDKGDSARILKNAGINQERVYQALEKIRGGHRVTDQRAESK